MRRISILIALLLAGGRFGALFPPAARAGAPILQPAVSPLAVIRLTDFAFPEKLSETGTVRALGLAEADPALRLPGFGELPPLRSLLAALRESGARDFWCCLLPDGGAWFSLISLMGGEWPDRGGGEEDAGAAFADWLASRTSGTGGTAAMVSRPEPGVVRRLIARDESTLRRALVGQPTGRRGGDPWRESLTAFLAGKPAGLAIWLDFRPLLGFASLVAGIDLRGGLGRFGLRIPDSLEIELLPKDAELAAMIRINRLLPEPSLPSPGADSEPPGLQLRESGKSHLHLADAAALLRAFQWDDNPLFLANLDLRALLPRSLDVVGWRDGKGEPHWFMVGRMGERMAFIRHYRRLLAWLDLLAASPESSLAGSAADPLREGNPRCLTINGISLLVGLDGAKDDASQLFFLAAGRREDYPDLGRLTFIADQAEETLTWELFLDERSRCEIAVWLTELCKENGWPALAGDVIKRWLAEGSAGSLRLPGVSPELRWRNGTAVSSLGGGAK